jgi:hypothetical protein
MNSSTTYLFRAFRSTDSGKIYADTGLSASNPVQAAHSLNLGARFIVDGEVGETYTNWRADALPFSATTLA